MPLSVLRQVPVDHVLPARDIGPLVEKLCTEPVPNTEPPVDEVMKVETDMATLDAQPVANEHHPGQPSPYSCPDCSGVLSEIREGKLVRYRCRVGHAWSSESLLDIQADKTDSALWMALRTLEEKAALSQELAARAAARGGELSALRYREQAAQATGAAGVIRSLLQTPRVGTPEVEQSG
jgi:two-component system, chemotaxis family, protein-glutamate methylesterase/glutaminase